MIYVILSYLLSPLIFLLAALRRKETPVNILVIQTAKIGDLICSTPVFREVKKKFPAARLTAIISPVTEKLLLNNPYVDKIITLKNSEYRGLSGRIRLSALIRRGGYEIAVCLNPNVPFAVSLFWGLVPLRLSVMPDYCGLTFRMASLLFSHLERHERGRLLIETYMKMLKRIGINSDDISKEVYRSDGAEKKVTELLGNFDNPLIGIAVSSGNKMKELGSAKISGLSNKILSNLNVVLVLIGSGADMKASENIISSIHNKEKIINAAGKLGLDELPALIERLSLFIGVDTGITYMADALSIPLIDISGPSDMKDQRPTNKNAVIIKKDIPCVPCSHAFNSPYDCKLSTRECITGVSVEEVFSAVPALLNSR